MKYRIGLDLGGTNIVCGLVNDDFELLSMKRIKTPKGEPVSMIVDMMAELAIAVREDIGAAKDDIECVGVGAPGFIEPSEGIVKFAPNLGWHDVALKREIQKRVSTDSFVVNDANAFAYGEYLAGAAKGSKTSITLTLGTGIGTGFIADGKIYEGANFAALEAGHMVIHEGGRKCRCGRLGCFERYASATGLKLTTREYMGKYPESVLWDFCEGRDEDVSGNHPFEAAEKGDAAAQEIIKVFIKDLACGVVNLINLFQPEVLVIAGGVAGAGEALLAPLTEIVKKEIYTKELEDNNARILLSELGDNAAIIGSAFLKK